LGEGDPEKERKLSGGLHEGPNKITRVQMLEPRKKVSQACAKERAIRGRKIDEYHSQWKKKGNKREPNELE